MAKAEKGTYTRPSASAAGWQWPLTDKGKEKAGPLPEIRCCGAMCLLLLWLVQCEPGGVTGCRVVTVGRQSISDAACGRKKKKVWVCD